MNGKNLTLEAAMAGLETGEFSALELTDYYLDRIGSENRALNAYLALDADRARRAAKESDRRRRQDNPRSRFDGIPFSVKDSYLVKGLLTTAGSKILKGFIPSYTASVVEKAFDAGCVLLGKTNMDSFGHGSSTENSAFGPSLNPHDRSRVAGGSSGGSAASVAADLAVFSIGEDTGGSIRQPAAFCGIVGFKPSYGRVSRYGCIAYGSSLDTVGPMTRTVSDARLVFDLIKGADDFDATSFDLKPKGRTIRLKGLKIGLPKEYFGQGLAKEIRSAIDRLVGKLKSAGVEIGTVSLPSTEYAIAAYYLIAMSETSSNLARFDGLRFGHHATKAKSLKAVYLQTRAEGFSSETKRRILLGTFALSAGYYEAYYQKAMKVRTLIKADFERAFQSADLLLAPVSPNLAFKVGATIADPLKLYLADAYTISANMAGIPALALPIGAAGKLPIGVQLMAPYGSDEALLALGQAVERLI